MMSKFIMTNDKETADKLKTEGYTLVVHDGDTYVFANDSKNKFDKQLVKKVVFTNAIAI